MRQLDRIGKITWSGGTRGKWVDAAGKPVHGIHHETGQRVQHKMVFNDGYVLIEYTYPVVKRSFKSPMLNDYNLHFINPGWKGTDGKALVNRVAKGLKPAGITWGELAELLELEDMAKNAGLMTFLRQHHPQSLYELGFTCKGTFGTTFDLQSLVDDYARAGLDARHLLALVPVRLLTALRDWDDTDPPLTGLLLGYPIETTWAVMRKTLKFPS